MKKNDCSVDLRAKYLIIKFLLLMKLAVFMILLSAFQAVAITGSSQKRINLTLENRSITSILKTIESKYAYRFGYSDSVALNAEKVSIYAKEATIDFVMQKLLQNTSFSYKKINNSLVVIIGRKTVTASIPVKGRVITEKSEPLSGVSIIEKGTTNGTTTNQDGIFSLAVSDENAILVISSIGYKTQEVPALSNQELIIQLLPNEQTQLDDVVVVGYGTQRKASVTGAISTVKAEDLTRTPLVSPTNALAGRIPGLVYLQSYGVPGDDAASLSIRGFGNALVIVDGIEADFRFIDPNQIESITVLKDASSAIYGARAGNGVILVTTKRGKTGKPVFTINSSYTLQGITDMPKTMSSGQYTELLREKYLNAGNPPSTAPFTEEQIQKYYAGNDPGYPNTNWYDELIRPWAPQQQHNISIRGGNENIGYYGFLGYTNQESVFKKDFGKYQRYSFQSNIDIKILDNLKMQITMASNIDDRKYPQIPIYSGEYSSWGFLWNTLPIYPATLPDKSKISYANGNGTGGAHVITNRGISGYNNDEGYNNNITLSLNYDFKFVKGLSFKVFGNYARFNGFNKVYAKPVTFYTYEPSNDVYTLAGAFGTKASLNETFSKASTFTSQLSFNYDRVFSEKHHITALALYENINANDDRLNASRRDFISSDIDQIFAGSSSTATNDGRATESGRLSYVGRLNYSFTNKYLLEAIIRADASAKFPPGKRWGYFPGVLLGWRLDQEDFLNNNHLFDLLKLRMSYGQAGNDAIGNFQYLSGYQLFPMTYLIGTISQNGLESKGLANPDLTWERIKTMNLGVDFSLDGKKIYGAADVFRRMRSGILATRITTLPSSFGATLPPENINSQVDRGFEFEIGTTGGTPDFNWDVSGNISWSRAKWDHYEEPEYTDNDQIRLFKGSGNWTDRTIGYLSDGLFTTQEEINGLPYQYPNGNGNLRLGDLRIIDLNKDGVIDWRDQSIIGQGTTPHWMLGLNTVLKYKNFDFSGLIQGAMGFYKYITFSGGQTTYFDFVYDNRWTPENNNKNALVPRLGGAPTNDYTIDARYVKSDYARLKILSLGYSLPQHMLNRIKLKQIRIYLSGSNLITISGLKKYSFDPEAVSGETGRYYPQNKTISAGANISF